MKVVCAPLLLLLLFAVGASAAGLNEEYVWVYALIQQGESLEKSDRTTEALAVYLDAEKALKRIKQSNPQWNPKVVDFRLRFLRARIAALEHGAPDVLPAGSPAVSTERAGRSDALVERLTAEVRSLEADLQQLQADNNVLHAKLKEALSVRPAAADPRELEKSEQQNRSLAKQIELLQMQLAEAQSGEEVTADARSLKEAQEELQAETSRADQLSAERARLASQVAALTVTVEAGEALREENALLKRQLSQLETASAGGESSDVENRLNQVLTELALLHSEADILRLEKMALEQRVKGLRNRSATPTAEASVETSEIRERVAELERERDQLTMQLAQANQDLADLSLASVGEPNGLAQTEVERLKARVAVYEAEKVPYSAEELVLFRMSRALESSDASNPRLPSGVSPLVAQAERKFKEGDFQQAELTLKEILKTDDSNAFTLANLAAAEMEQGKDAEAEVHLRRALASAPRDPFTLATMGILKFRQQEYEDALDYLGLAAQYNPDSPVIQNYLGMTLSEQGMRGPAETALRRAIQLQPGFSDAHFNLALVYLFQDPPLRELARWHYQKALQAEHERSPELERLLDQRTSN